MQETPLAAKLGIKPKHRILLLNAPEGYLQSLGELPEGTDVKTKPEGTFDFVQVFVHSKADVDTYAATAMQAVKPGGLLWFSYPKKTSKVKTDVTRDTGWETLRSAGIRPVSQIALDDTWSALRFRPESEVKPRKIPRLLSVLMRLAAPDILLKGGVPCRHGNRLKQSPRLWRCRRRKWR